MSGAPADWYPQEDGQLRYWDGAAWTEHFAPGAPPATGAIENTVRAVIRVDSADDPDAIWRATGKPITGIGGGRYKLTASYLFFERGTLSTNAQQVPVSAIFDVDVRQTMAQKARSLGSITLHVQRPQGMEVVTLDDIPNFREGQRAINDAAHAARLTIQRNENTHRYETSQPLAHQPQASSPAAAGAAPDLLAQLRQLGELKDAGILTEEEFAAKKAEILARL
jgi:hypothetical protein